MSSALRLRTQLLLAMFAILLALTATSLLVVRHSVRGEVRRQTAEAVTASVRAFDRVQQQQRAELGRTAALLSQLPTLKAVMTTEHAATIQDASTELWQLSGSDVFVLADPAGRVMAVHASEPGMSRDTISRLLTASLSRGEHASWWHDGSDLFLVVTRPIIAGSAAEQHALGTLVLGHRISTAVAQEIGRLAGSDIAVTARGSIVALSLPTLDRAELQQRLRSIGVAPREVTLGDRHFEVGVVSVDTGSPTEIRCYMLLPIDSAYAFLERLNRILLVLGGLAAALGALLVTIISRAITRPVDRLVSAVRALAAGDPHYRLVSKGSVEVAELANAFGHMREQLAESQRRQLAAERLAALGRAAGSISHDLRHHLAALVANAEFLHDAKRLGFDRDEIFREIERATGQMTGLIDSLVEISRENRTLSLSEERLVDIVRSAADAVRANPDFHGRKIEIAAECETRGAFDARKLERAFFNLLLNACEATSSGQGAVGVRITREGDTFVCRVWDNGCGVPESVRHNLFEPFVSAGKNNGTGLGLAIASKIIHDHEGEISVEQTSSSGTTFALSLPYRKMSVRCDAATLSV